ncbi:hypothetical protein DL93DRAFT_2071798 [Clavulina sp. PMI_390]|nr:hypothetical protein DL93DRAFT_2071798 [Clavulina sp. PMI_390]
MRIETVFAAFTALALCTSTIADFHYGTARCAIAGDGFFEAGFILDANSTNFCLSAFNSFNIDTYIPVNSTHPNAMVCDHNVTINTRSHNWFSTDNGGVKSKYNHGSCTRTNITMMCNPPYAECFYTNLLNCSSTFCGNS